jgi:hypothetical protein
LRSDFGAIKNRGTHADEDFVADFAGMDDCGVSDSDKVSEFAREVVGEVEDGVILDVRVVSDNDTIDVAAKHGVVPDAGMITDGNVANNDRALGDVNTGAQGGFFEEEGRELGR